jgi:hypothetical protein
LLTPDFNGDRTVTTTDVEIIATAFGSADHPLYDLNGDGELTGLDIVLTVQQLGQTSSLLEQQIVK